MESRSTKALNPTTSNDDLLEKDNLHHIIS